MKSILSPASRGVLRRLAGSHALLAFDYDGTLAPIVRDRSRARMRPETLRLFRELCTAYPSAVISGRRRRDVVSLLPGADVKYVVGNHGLEPTRGMARFARAVAAARPALAAALADVPGVDVEDKELSLSVHYRASRKRREARTRIFAAVAALPVKMRTIPGKLVVNVVPAGAPNKGDALLHLRNVERAETALYVGDDQTDEDVFERGEPGRLFTVRVGRSSSSSADYFVRRQTEVDALLESLLSYRTASGRA